MAIKKCTLYIIECDKCGYVVETMDVMNTYATDSEAIEVAEKGEWHVEPNGVACYCDICWDEMEKSKPA